MSRWSCSDLEQAWRVTRRRQLANADHRLTLTRRQAVRTLHHYDKIGLLRPEERTAAGYRWFFDVAPTMHRQVAGMYVADPRFTKFYDDIQEGLARYIRDAVHANADRQESAES